MSEKKIVRFEDISSRVKRLKAARPDGVVVLCHGCFDIVHPGHIRHLKFAKEQGSFLIVSITPDICMQKGSSRPFMPQDLRAENLAALEIVDAVTIAPGDTGIEPIEQIRPDIYIKGSEYATSSDPRFIKEKDLVENLGGRVVYSSGEVVFSSSELIREHDLDLALTEKLNYICKRYSITRQLLSNALDKAPERSVLIIGEAILEERLYCEGLGISQESPVLSIAQRHKSLLVGGAGSVALHLAASGVKVSFLTSMTSSGQSYDFFKLSLEEAGVRLVNIEDKFRPVCVKSHYFVDRNQVMEVERGAHRPIDSALKSAITKEFRKSLKPGFGCVIYSDYGYGLLSNDLVREFTLSASSKKVLSVADISMSLRTNLEKFSGSDIFNATEAELRSCMHDYESGLSVLVDRFYKDYDVAELYLLLSDGGALYFRPPEAGDKGHQSMESIHIPQLLVRREGRMGLPEAFLAGLALGRSSGLTQEASTYLAAAFAAVHSRSGHSIKTVEMPKLRQLLSERKELD